MNQVIPIVIYTKYRITHNHKYQCISVHITSRNSTSNN